MTDSEASILNLKDEIAELKAVIEDCEDAANKGKFPTKNDVGDEVSIWRRIELAGELLSEYKAILKEYLEWGPMTGSDRDYFAKRFRELTND